MAEGRRFEQGRCPLCDTRLSGLPGPPEVALPQQMLPFSLTENDARRALADWQAYPDDPVRWRGVFLPLYAITVDGRPGLATAAPEAEALLPQSGRLRAAWAQAKPLELNVELLSKFDLIVPSLSPNEAVEHHQFRLIEDALEDHPGSTAALRERKAILQAAPPSVADPVLIVVPVWIAAVANTPLIAVDGWSGAVAREGQETLFTRMIARLKR
ncbi:MAG: hypothetical protein AAGH74_16715 [Pseudomonadota bacterium]